MDRAKLIELLSCPLKWAEVCPELELVTWLNFAWYATARRHDVDREAQRFISCEDFTPSSYELETLDEHEIRSACLNVKSWQEGAEQEYRKVYGGLFRQRALRRNEMPKHYAQRAVTPAEVAAESRKRGEAVLRAAIDETVQLRLLWAALNEVVLAQVRCNQLEAHSHPEEPATALAQMFDRHFLLVAADVNRPVGASRGEETKHLLLNLDLVNGHFHCYPITAAELHEQEFQAHVQGWNLGLEC